MSTTDQNSSNPREDWLNSKWRPVMGWMYMVVCAFDFIVAPILWSLLNAMTQGSPDQWNPLTLQGAGLFHISMGAVLGIAALGRTQEKLAGANNGGLSIQAPTPTAMTPPQQTGFNSGFTAPAAAPVQSFVAPTLSSTGKKVVPVAADPVI